MASRRLTVFPRTGHALPEGTNAAGSHDGADLSRGSKRRFISTDRVVDLQLAKTLAPTGNLHRFFTPINDDPERFYQCIYLVDPEGTRPYCLAQEKMLTTNESPYRIVMIRRSAARVVAGVSKPNPNLLNVIGAFHFNNSIYTIFDRPGISLSEIALCPYPQLGLAQIQTISKEALSGISTLVGAGFFLPRIHLEDITVSPYNGQVKVGFDQAVYQGPEVNLEASNFMYFLEDLIARVPDYPTVAQHKDLCNFIESGKCKTYAELQRDDFLKHSLPASSLIPLVLVAQTSVLSMEHATETRIGDLKEQESYT